ncbi:MAG: hypothetical protein R3E82_22345 [Pseudomonadales bacterium]
MKHDDPLDDLLQRAFATERAALDMPDVAGTVLQRMRRRARLRALVLGSVGLICVAVLEMSNLSLGSILTFWGRELTVLLHGDAILSVTLVLLGLAAIVATDAEFA